MSYYNEENPEPMRSLVWIIVSALVVTFLWVAAIAFGDDHMSSEQLILKQIRLEEGFRGVPYRDTLNNWTVGFGSLIGGRTLTKIENERLYGSDQPLSIAETVQFYRNKPMSEEDATYLLERDIKIAEMDAKMVYADWEDMPSEKKVPIIDMLYNLGLPKYRKFRRHIAAVKRRDWKEAAKEVRNSLAYIQAPNRYKRIVKELAGVE